MHARLAEEVFGPNWTGIQRRYAKNIGYGFFYGLTSPTTASKYIGGPDGIKLAVKILTGLKEMYPNVVRLMKRTQREAEKLGYVKIHDTAWPGRYRRFVTEAEQKPYAYTALNAKVQGGIGEMMKDVMLAAEPHLDIVGARLDLQVHDELVIEVPIGYGPEVLCSLQYVLDKVNPFDMPMVFTGKPWSEHE
jgi:DNA polymerase-1